MAASVRFRRAEFQIDLADTDRLIQSNQLLTDQMRTLLRTVVGQARNDSERP
jgi:hypothetical protein